MIPRMLAALTLLASPVMAAEDSVPATVVVAFDQEAILPVIVEGIADRTSGRAVAVNDPVRIASISKLVMALATLRLVDEGKVDLHADVSDYLGWQLRAPGFPEAKVTLAQLLGHRAGLRDRAGYVIPLGESLQSKLADPEAWYPDAPPGEAPFEYANLGSPVVATVLEAATMERYDRIVERTVFGPLGIRACLNWIGCDKDITGSAVTLYRATGEVARDGAADLPPNCTIPVADGIECSLDEYVPGTNASIFSPQGGVRIGMVDLARIGQELLKPEEESFLSRVALGELIFSMMGQSEGQEFFCSYGLAIQMIEVPSEACDDRLFQDGRVRVGHAGEAYGLRSGLWLDMQQGRGIAYFTTAVPPRATAEDEGGFDPREVELMRRATSILEKGADD